MRDAVETLIGAILAGTAIVGLWVLTAFLIGISVGLAIKAAHWVM